MLSLFFFSAVASIRFTALPSPFLVPRTNSDVFYTVSCDYRFCVCVCVPPIIPQLLFCFLVQNIAHCKKNYALRSNRPNRRCCGRIAAQISSLRLLIVHIMAGLSCTLPWQSALILRASTYTTIHNMYLVALHHLLPPLLVLLLQHA